MITKTTNIVLVSGQCYHINSDNTKKWLKYMWQIGKTL